RLLVFFAPPDALCYGPRLDGPGAPMSVALDLDHTAPAARKPRAGKLSLVGLDRGGLADALGTAGIEPREAKMRANQLWNWIYHRGVTDFEAMSNIGKGARQRLAENFRIERPEIVTEQVST